MANNPYVNKVVYGNTTVMDISGDTVTANDVAQGKTFHDATGAAKTGSYVAPTITQITPSNSSPVPLTSGNNYQPTANGKAVASVTDITPSNADIEDVSVNDVIRITSVGGQVIRGLADVTPSNANPIDVDSANMIARFDSSGVIIKSLDNATPSNDPVPVASGDIYKMGGNGYAIESYVSRTPSSSGTAFPAGFVKMSSGGYAYDTQPTPTPTKTTLWTNPSPTSDYPSGTSAATINATLSDDMDNYQYLEFVFRKSTSNSDTFSMIIPVSEFKLTEGGTGSGKYRYLATVATSYTSNMRGFYYGDDTTVTFERFITYRQNSSNIVNNSLAVPIYIKGINL